MKSNKRRSIALLLAVVLCFLCGAGSVMADQNTIHIASAEELLKLSDACKYDAYSRDKTVLLDVDIDLGETDYVPIPTFGGTFDGQGHTISGLSLDGDGAHMGLFRYVQEGGTVKNLTVTGNIDSAGTMSEIGAIVGTNMGTITGCTFSGTISGASNVGGIAGTNEATGMIYDCKTEGYAAGDHYVGGIVGQNLGTVSYCSNTAGVNINASDSAGAATENLDDLTFSGVTDDSDDDEPKRANTSTDVGGIAGFSSGVIIGCTNWGNIGFQHVGYNIGGVVGRQSGLVSGCTNWGTAYGRKDVGGVVGQMEPYITLDLGAGSAAKMAEELNTLHDLMNTLLNHTGAASSAISATLGAISNSAASATENARYVAERTATYVDDTTGTVNEMLLRINTAEKMLSPAITEFSQGSVSLDSAIRYFSSGFDYLDAIDEMTATDKEAFKNAASDLSTSSEKLNAAMDYCAWLMKVIDNSYGTGNYDLDAERPDNWLEASNKYGYEYDPDNLSTYETQRDALLKGAGDAADATGAVSGDISTMTKIINIYYLTEDKDGNTRLDNMSKQFQNAFTELKSATGHLSTGMSYLDQMAKYLSSNEPLSLPGVGSDFRTAMEGMFDDLGSISSGLSRLSVQTATYSNQIVNDMKAVNDQFNVVMMELCDILELALNPTAEDILQDVSEEDIANTTNGKVYNCENYGCADGDIDVGGIVGTMAIEYDFDPEGDSNVMSENSLTSKYFTKCVLVGSTNYGSAVSRKDYAGGICGLAELGVISGCEGYGTAESTAGDYVGGIVGMSESSVRDSFAKCEVIGDSYIGGVAGLGTNVTGCNTLVNLNSTGNCVGTIAGELTDDGSASDNFFVHETEAGIDGISYQGKAENMTYDEFMARSGVPAEFSSFAVTFTANGEVVKSITFAYGASIDKSQIPECPALEGNYGKWPEYDYSHLTFDVEIKAEYTASTTVIAGDLYSDDSSTPVVLAEGIFDPATDVHVTESASEGPTLTGNQKLLLKYDVEISNDTLDSDTDASVAMRVYVPESSGRYNVYVYRDGAWNNVSYTRDGSYLVFNSAERDLRFAVVSAQHSVLFYILLVLIVAAVVVTVVRLLLRRKATAAVAAGEAQSPAEQAGKNRFLTLFTRSNVKKDKDDAVPQTAVPEKEAPVEEATAEEMPSEETNSETSSDETE